MESANKLSFAELLASLEAAVNEGNLARARELERIIQQRLVIEAAERAEIERRVRALITELERQTVQPSVLSFDPFDIQRSSTPDSEPVVYPVWFGTNRRMLTGQPDFAAERGDGTTCGRAEVYIPDAHRFGETGTSFLTRLLRFDLRDDSLRLQHVAIQERNAFFSDIGKVVQAVVQDGEEPHALFFLHGYNVSFADAAIRAAQIGYDLKVTGPTAFFSWPSRGRVAAYPSDEAAIEASEGAITKFLVDFAGNCGAKKVHVIAHSMGNRGLLRALQRIAANAETRGKVKFAQIFLAAPDVDRDLFLDLAYLYREHAERATLYASGADLAVHLSSRVHEAPRAGYFTPYTVAAGVDTVAVPSFDVDLLGHSYYAEAEALLYDINALMRKDCDPAQRQRIEAIQVGDEKFWKLRR